MPCQYLELDTEKDEEFVVYFDLASGTREDIIMLMI